jgi:hypothetical protein
MKPINVSFLMIRMKPTFIIIKIRINPYFLFTVFILTGFLRVHDPLSRLSDLTIPPIAVLSFCGLRQLQLYTMTTRLLQGVMVKPPIPSIVEVGENTAVCKLGGLPA